MGLSIRRTDAWSAARADGNVGRAKVGFVIPLAMRRCDARDALRAKNPGFREENIGMRPISSDMLEMAINDPSVKDVSPLKKQRIAILDLRSCDVTDLSPLEGMPISQLYLEESKRLSDLSPLRGMPLNKL
jgi:hypothetical protein